jgi:hypothetical protein
MNLHVFRAIADRLRPLAEPIRTISVRVRTRTWTGDRVGSGVASDSDLVLPGYVNVRQVTAKEVASSGGRLREGAVRIGPITPTYSAFGVDGGITPAQLRPAANARQEIIWVLAGELAGEFALAELDTTKPLSWFATANRMRSTP